MKKNTDKTLENFFGILVFVNLFFLIYLAIFYELNFIFAIILLLGGTVFTYVLYKASRDERIKKERDNN